MPIIRRPILEPVVSPIRRAVNRTRLKRELGDLEKRTEKLQIEQGFLHLAAKTLQKHEDAILEGRMPEEWKLGELTGPSTVRIPTSTAESAWVHLKTKELARHIRPVKKGVRLSRGKAMEIAKGIRFFFHCEMTRGPLTVRNIIENYFCSKPIEARLGEDYRLDFKGLLKSAEKGHLIQKIKKIANPDRLNAFLQGSHPQARVFRLLKEVTSSNEAERKAVFDSTLREIRKKLIATRMNVKDFRELHTTSTEAMEGLSENEKRWLENENTKDAERQKEITTEPPLEPTPRSELTVSEEKRRKIKRILEK